LTSASEIVSAAVPDGAFDEMSNVSTATVPEVPEAGDPPARATTRLLPEAFEEIEKPCVIEPVAAAGFPGVSRDASYVTRNWTARSPEAPETVTGTETEVPHPPDAAPTASVAAATGPDAETTKSNAVTPSTAEIDPSRSVALFDITFLLPLLARPALFTARPLTDTSPSRRTGG
jgi:hypothetical protein